MKRTTLILCIVVLASGPLSGEEAGYSIDGHGNNEANPDWGMADTQLIRLADSFYDDKVSSLAGVDRPNPRQISNIVLDQGNVSIPNARGMSDMIWQWGQFLDHDIDLTEGTEEAADIVLEDDPVFGDSDILFNRSIFDPLTGTNKQNPRQQLNEITAFIDGSNVYGSDEITAALLREWADGKLKVTPSAHGDLLPFDEFGFFMAGDIRVNEQAYLTAMHTLWMREHNRLANELSEDLEEELEGMSAEQKDEVIYQCVRRIVIAELQAITYNEFLPALLGPDAIPVYAGYDPTVNPGIANEFSTAAFRLGHSMLNSVLLRLKDNGHPIQAGPLPLRAAFFDPSLILDYGIDPYLKGLTAQAAQEIDSKIVDDVRNFLFGDPGEGGLDLGSLNIQRGRDHGLPSYIQMRQALFLPTFKKFSELPIDESVQADLLVAYADEHDNEKNAVQKIDLWVGAIAEQHVPGGSVGPLLREILVDQFIRLRDGDRFWYEGVFTGSELETLRNTRLADVIARNTKLKRTNLPDNVFFLPVP